MTEQQICDIEGRSWATHQESNETKEYLLNKYFPYLEQRKKGILKYICHCKIGSTVWCIGVPTPEKKEELHQIVFGKLDPVDQIITSVYQRTSTKNEY